MFAIIECVHFTHGALSFNSLKQALNITYIYLRLKASENIYSILLTRRRMDLLTGQRGMSGPPATSQLIAMQC